jgi:F-type H+-transporting ATPase subunit delta
MRDRKVATRYAGALLASARQAGVLDGVAESYAAVLDVVAGNGQLITFMDSPQVATQEKKDLLQNVFGDHVEPVLLHFFNLLIDKKRIESLRDIGEEFAAQVEAERGVMRAKVVTAVALDEELSGKLQTKLAGLTGKQIILEKKVDPAVIGGVRVTMQDKILDGTVRTNLDLLRKKLEKAPVRFTDAT